MPPTRSPKELIESVYAELAVGNARPLLDSMADDVVWRVSGSGPWARAYSGKASVVNDLLRPLNSLFEGRYTAVATRVFGEGSFVAAEVQGAVMLKSGKPYNNRYCFIYRIEDGKIKEITEYMDTELVATTVVPLGIATGSE